MALSVLCLSCALISSEELCETAHELGKEVVWGKKSQVLDLRQESIDGKDLPAREPWWRYLPREC